MIGHLFLSRMNYKIERTEFATPNDFYGFARFI